MADHKKIDVDQEQLADAHSLWDNFARLSKYSVYAIAVVLILMALYFVDFTATR